MSQILQRRKTLAPVSKEPSNELNGAVERKNERPKSRRSAMKGGSLLDELKTVQLKGLK